MQTLFLLTGNLFILANSHIALMYYYNNFREFTSGSLRCFSNQFSTYSFCQARPLLGVSS
nr:MAG TPA: hypothetical protein [Caudoviricetes sp.]